MFPLTPVPSVVLYWTWMAQACRVPFFFAARDQPVPFHASCGLPPVQLAVGMYIDAAVGPDTSPRRVVDEHHVCAPVKAAQTPSPRTKCRGNGDAEAKADSGAHNDSRPRRKKNHQRIVGRHTDECRIHRQNLKVRAAAYDDSIVAPQIAKIFCLLPHSLYRVHHVLMLREKSIAQIPGPFHIRSHHLQDRWERKQRQHAWVPRQMVLGNGLGELVPGQIVMFIRPLGSVGDLVGKSCGGKELRQKRVGIQRDPRDQPIQLFWRIGRRSLGRRWTGC